MNSSPAGSEQTHRAQIDVLVAAHRSGNRGARLRERRRIEHDRVESDALAFARLEVLERIRLDELAVRQSIALEVLLRARERVRRCVERDDRSGAPREM